MLAITLQMHFSVQTSKELVVSKHQTPSHHCLFILGSSNKFIDCSDSFIINKSTKATHKIFETQENHSYRISKTRYYNHENGIQPCYPNKPDGLKIQFWQLRY